MINIACNKLILISQQSRTNLVQYMQEYNNIIIKYNIKSF